jgi:hypothetical protein
MHVPRLGIHSGYDSVRGDPRCDAPLAVATTGVVGRLDVLAGDQRQQRQRLLRGLLQWGLAEGVHYHQRISYQG